MLTSPTASGKTLSTYPAILEGCINEEHRALAFYGLRALALDQFHKISELLSTIPTQSRPILATIVGDVKSEKREQALQKHNSALQTADRSLTNLRIYSFGCFVRSSNFLCLCCYVKTGTLKSDAICRDSKQFYIANTCILWKYVKNYPRV
ncbi:DEAD/DEAH box helicase [Nostoc sp. LEGE 12450]|uniref:DEAD/DEAH box helicase n=1 Tax=Nostoc sp. LEGE 12450 TaxID=1828643 RepID=UPI003A0FCEF2